MVGWSIDQTERRTKRQTPRQVLLSSESDGQYCKSAGLLVPCEKNKYVHARLWLAYRLGGGGLTVRRPSGSLRVMGDKTSVQGVEKRESVALCSSSSSSLSHNRNVQC